MTLLLDKRCPEFVSVPIHKDTGEIWVERNNEILSIEAAVLDKGDGRDFDGIAERWSSLISETDCANFPRIDKISDCLMICNPKTFERMSESEKDSILGSWFDVYDFATARMAIVNGKAVESCLLRI